MSDGPDGMRPSGDRLDLSADELLSTTRAVRKRLDLTRPVDPTLIDECLEMAAQAPTGGNGQGWHFVVVTDPAKRAALAEMYQRGFEMMYGDREAAEANLPTDDAEYVATTKRVIDSAEYLAEHMAEVPVMVIPCINVRTDNMPAAMQAGVWGSLLPAVWSFMLAARERSLGTCWTSLHLIDEPAAAALLGIPDNMMQGALIPVAHSIGTDFKPAPRRDMSRIVHHDTWRHAPRRRRPTHRRCRAAEPSGRAERFRVANALAGRRRATQNRGAAVATNHCQVSGGRRARRPSPRHPNSRGGNDPGTTTTPERRRLRGGDDPLSTGAPANGVS